MMQTSVGTRTHCLDSSQVEQTINRLLLQEWESLNGDREQREYYESIFDRSGEEGFYDNPDQIRGQGERPDWRPNEAYIQSHEAMWEPVDEYLTSVGLQVESTFRELFCESREYQDTPNDHRRVFFGQLLDETGTAVTAFMLTVPHSHDRFEYTTPIQLALSKMPMG